jgi:hypothetical protein
MARPNIDMIDEDRRKEIAIQYDVLLEDGHTPSEAEKLLVSQYELTLEEVRMIIAEEDDG